MEVQQERLIYHDVLSVFYEFSRGKLNKLNVQLKQVIAVDGNKVFKLDIKGVKHNLNINLEFTEQELCFMNMEEIQVNTDNYCTCWKRNIKNTDMYTRLLLLFHCDRGNGLGANCITVPILQRGNINATMALKKLHDAIQTNIAQNSLKHWQVFVVRCDEIPVGQRVFLGLTNHAMFITVGCHIRHYHSFLSSEISSTTNAQYNEIVIRVQDISWTSRTPDTQNFSLVRSYVFQTAQFHQIETCIMDTLQMSRTNSIIPPHNMNSSNTRSSSSSNGYLSGQYNSYINPLSDTTDQQAPILVHFTDNDSSRSMSESFVQNSTTQHLQQPSISSLESSFISDETHTLSVVSEQKNTSIEQTSVKKPTRRGVSQVGHLQASPSPHSPSHDTDPCADKSISVYHHKRQTEFGSLGANCQDISVDEFDFQLMSPQFATGNELSLPLPPPCSATSQIFVVVPHRPLVPEPQTEDDEDETYVKYLYRDESLLRSCSTVDLSNSEMDSHSYINTVQTVYVRNSVFSDSPHYIFYYNLGFTKIVSRMDKKIKRRNRLSKEIKQLDFNKLENHEIWFDRDFKIRDKDLKFCRLNKLNIEAEEKVYSRLDEPSNDDPYWNGDLCVTLQLILQENHIFDEIQSTFDLSAEQLIAIQVLLSLVPALNNWKNLAEFIGLDSSNINVIEHFCYTYRELAAHVVFTHWMLQDHNGKSSIHCSHDSLARFIEDIDRVDILNIVKSQNVNCHPQNRIDIRQQRNINQETSTNEIIESTYF